MYSTKSINGMPSIQCNGRSILSVWNQDWEFAYEICQLLNGLDSHDPQLFLNNEDRKWLQAMDQAFTTKVHHV